MTIAVYQLDPFYTDFPPAEHALRHPNGLLAMGGDLSVKRLINAYQHGIFPWYNPGEPILWWSPDPRAILDFEDLHISRSLRKKIKQNKFSFSINKAFETVITSCALQRKNQEGTWITNEINQGFTQLHQAGLAHSMEVWQDQKLVGGLYGVSMGSMFAGESMFHTATDASKAALVALVDLLKSNNFHFIDCQLQNDHLESLGVKEIPRKEFLERLNICQNETPPQGIWLARDYQLSYE